MTINILSAVIISLIIGFVMGRWITKSEENDPVINCNEYRKRGCSYVDGLLCDFKNCPTRLEADLFELEERLDIPIKDRYCNRNN